MWIVCSADDSNEMSSIIFLKKKKSFRILSATLLNDAEGLTDYLQHILITTAADDILCCVFIKENKA